jgi:6-phosphofructokinase
MIRAIPSNASDNVFCTLLAQSAVHGAMAGYTGFTVGPVNGRNCYIPFHVSYCDSSRYHIYIVFSITVKHMTPISCKLPRLFAA